MSKYGAVDCPECGRGFVVNRRGKCRCGAYLVGVPLGPAFLVTAPSRTWFLVNGEWLRYTEVEFPKKIA